MAKSNVTLEEGLVNGEAKLFKIDNLEPMTFFMFEKNSSELFFIDSKGTIFCDPRRKRGTVYNVQDFTDKNVIVCDVDILYKPQ